MLVFNDELLDLFDENDNFVCTKLRSLVYKEHSTLYKKKIFFRSINAFLVNKEGKLFIPRRSKDKKICPAVLDASMAGHVSSKETYDFAFKRELSEELNLNADLLDYELKAKLSPVDHGLFCFANIYEIKYNKTPDYNKNDFMEYFWLFPEEIIKKLENGDRAKGDLPKIIKHLYL